MSCFPPTVRSDAGPGAGRLALLLLAATGTVACQSESDLLKVRDGGASGAGGLGASGAGGDGSGGRVTGGGGSDGAGSSGTGGSASGGGGGTGGAMGPLSTGTFPYPGRWWGRLTAPDRAGAFVIHWSASDPVDRGLWTRKHTYPLAATPGPEDGVTLRSAAPEMKGCWTLYATTDPNELRVQPCDVPPSSGQAALGFFRRGPRLVVQIPLPPVVGPPPVLVTTTASAFAGGGQWVAVAVRDAIDDRLWLWKNDVGRAFDLGRGAAWPVDFSADGRRIAYNRADALPSALIAYDTVTATARTVSSDGFARGMFSPDGRRYAFLDQPLNDPGLAVYDFDSDASVTLAPGTHLGVLSDEAVFLGGSRGIVFRAFLPNAHPLDDPALLYVHDFQTGATATLGVAAELTGIPGGTFAAFRTDGGPAMLVDGATLLRRALPGASIPAGPDTGYAGFQPTPDGKRLAYVDGDRRFHLVNLDGGPDLTLPGESGCLPDYCEDQWPRGSNLPNPPRAAKFTRDGAAIVRGLGTGCSRGFGFYSLGRYDLASGQESVLSLPELGSVLAFSPLGHVVMRVGLPPWNFWAWPAPLAPLVIPEEDLDYFTPFVDWTYSFTDDGRYLIYTPMAQVMVRDIAAGTTRRIAHIASPGVAAISRVTGITVAWVNRRADGTALTALFPDGSSLVLNQPINGQVLAEPGGTVISYPIANEAGEGTIVYRLQQNASPTLVGNGAPLAVSETQVIFRDLDGVCSYSW